MKPPKHTIQWIAPHLSEGELKAIYNAIFKEVIGSRWGEAHTAGQITDVSGTTSQLVIEQTTKTEQSRNELIQSQCAALATLFGMDG